MAEVFVVMFVKEGYDVTGTEWLSDIQLRQVFDSIEKARAYCEDPNSCADEFPNGYVKTFAPGWNDSGTIYTLLETDDEDMYFSIQARNLL